MKKYFLLPLLLISVSPVTQAASFDQTVICDTQEAPDQLNVRALIRPGNLNLVRVIADWRVAGHTVNAPDRDFANDCQSDGETLTCPESGLTISLKADSGKQMVGSVSAQVGFKKQAVTVYCNYGE